MLIHFRYEGRSRRTICGQRFLPGHRPRLLDRLQNVNEPPRPVTPEEIDSPLGYPCPECLRTAAEQIRLAQDRSRTERRPRRRFDASSGRWGDDDGVPDEASNREFVAEVDS